MISPDAIHPIQELKTKYLGSKNPRLHVDEILIALSMSAATSDAASLALEQITNQLAKLVDVREIKILEPDNSGCHELLMIKVAAKPEQRQGLISIADVFHAKVADVSVDSMILERTGYHNKLEAFLELMGDYEILELARTGMTGLSRGSQDVTYF